MLQQTTVATVGCTKRQDDNQCVAGAQVACACLGGTTGVQLCLANDISDVAGMDRVRDIRRPSAEYQRIRQTPSLTWLTR